MIARSLDPRLHKPVVVGLQAFFNPQSALASQAGCRALVCVAGSPGGDRKSDYQNDNLIESTPLCPPIDNVRKRARGGRETRRDV